MAQRFEVLAMDLFGPLPATPAQERWVLAIEDTASRWIELFPRQKATAEACAKCLINEVILRYGTPRKIISDNGPQFVGEVMQQVAYCLGFTQNLTPLYYPSANPEERRNRDIKTQLAILVEEKHNMWSVSLPSVRFAMNGATHGSTGKTPAFLCFGREMSTPFDVHTDIRAVVNNENFVAKITPYLKVIAETLKDSRERSEHQQDRAKKSADQRRRPTPTFDIGDKVLVDVHALSSQERGFSSKFTPRRDGPYIVIEKKSPVTYIVACREEPDKPMGKYHVSALRAFAHDDGDDEVQPVVPLRRRDRPKKAPAPEVVPDAEEDAAEPDVTQVQPSGQRLRKRPTCTCCT